MRWNKHPAAGVAKSVSDSGSNRPHTGRLRRGRRALLALALGAGSAACGVAAAHATHRGNSGARLVSPAPSSAQGSPQLVAVRSSGYVVRGESFPVLKRLAVEVALRLTSYDASASPSRIAAAVTSDPARRRALVSALAPLFHHGAVSTGSVVYPQMGGATSDRASVMVVVRQSYVVSGRHVTQTRILDVRLFRSASGWHFDALASAGGTPVARPATLTAAERSVVDNPRILLPDTARWDIYRGRISPVLLQLMARIAQRTPIAVTVLETGHPYDVFGTGHASLHSSGRAVDINALGNVHVVSSRTAGSPAYRLVEWLLAQPQVSQVGSPWDLDGSSNRSFTNAVHLDHIHVSV